MSDDDKDYERVDKSEEHSEPKDGKCNANAKHGGYCWNNPARFPEDYDGDRGEPGEIINGRCKFHGGHPKIGAPKNNDYPVTHGMLAKPSTLYTNMDPAHKRMVDRWRDDIVSDIRERGASDEPVSYLEAHAWRVAMNIYRVTVLVEEWEWKVSEEGSLDNPASGNPLVQYSYEDETEFGLKYNAAANIVHSVASNLSRENRMWLKDMGLLDNSPDAEAAKATGSLVDILSGDGEQ